MANPEEAVEAAWYRRAAAGTFQDVLLVGGLTLMALTLTGFELSATTLLLILIALAMADFLARHSLIKRAGS